MSLATFARAPGAASGGSPRIAETTRARHPFPDRDPRVTQAVAQTFFHPDLADRERRPTALATFSKTERAHVGPDDLAPEKVQEQRSLNTAHREKFGFPLIKAARNSTRQQVLERKKQRPVKPADVEFQRALKEIYRLADFRLNELVMA